MKKIYALLIIALLALPGCFDDGDSTALKVTVNYTGTNPEYGDTDGSSAGTAKNYVYLYEALGARSNSPDPEPVYSTSLNSNNSSVAIDVDPGEYYVAVCYDFRGASGDPKLTKQNPYALYISSTGETTPLITEAEKIAIADNETKNIFISFNHSWKMGTESGANGRDFLTTRP